MGVARFANGGALFVQVAQGLIYVWPEAGPQADAEAWSRKPHLLPWVDEQVRRNMCPCNVRRCGHLAVCLNFLVRR